MINNMKYSLTIFPKSYLHCGSGDGGVLVDSDVVFHSSGFPMIPARRLKGLLRESMLEVLEIVGDESIEEKIESWFGKPGDDYANGLIYRIGNAYVDPWQEIKSALKRGENPGRDAIIAYATTEVQQTALNEGIAKKHSLSNYRVVNPRVETEFKFEATIETSRTLSGEENELIQRSVSNLRFIGSRRNRGFGHVSCAIQKLETHTPNALLTSRDISNISGIELSLNTQSPIIISKQDGDLNTLQTHDVITGAQIRGALARWYMKKENLYKENAHNNPIFHKVFLSGEIHFGSLFYNNAKTIPAFVHRLKYATDELEPLNVFESKNQITKAIGGVGIYSVESQKLFIKKQSYPKKESNFHNSRQNRTAGRNTGKELFYYEALQEDQNFKGIISGTPAALKILAEILPSELTVTIGRSKSAQYGQATISSNVLQEDSNSIVTTDRRFLVIAETPVVLVNEYNFPELDCQNLEKALRKSLGDLAVEKIVGSTTLVESYNAVWQSKSGKYPAYAAGTTFMVHIKDNAKAPSTIHIGKFVELGYGKCKIIPFIQTVELQEEEKHSEQSIEIKVPLLKNIKTEALRSEKKRKIEEKSINDAKSMYDGKKIRLNNHQCGRLETIFSEADDFGYVINFLKSLGDKPLAVALKKSRVLIELYGGTSDNELKLLMQKPLKEFNDVEWIDVKTYWLTFFRIIRKLNK